MKAFDKFKEIDGLKDLRDKHREWLRQHEGLKFGRGVDGHYLKGEKWTESKYSDNQFDTNINLVGRLPTQSRIEFDGEPDDAKKYLDIVEKKLQENKWGYIRTTHNGKCDYLWIEFDCLMKDKDIKSFLRWIAPEGSVVDENFASSKKIFPCLYAVHWKHSHNRELPVRFFEGEKICFSSLGIKKVKRGSSSIKIEENGFGYETFTKAISLFTDKITMAKNFYKIQPIYYDHAGLFWLWNNEMKYWKMFDEVDIMNVMYERIGADTISSSERNEILQALKQVGRMNKPLDLPKTWIQFKNGIIDLNNEFVFIEPSPKYFAVNPIPWNIGKSKDTPNMDRIFSEWVGEDNVKTLYEILAYCLLMDYPIHRIFCFIGGGLNGKSKFLDLLRMFIGQENCCSTELDTLITSRFEVTRLHKKLVCQMGETNFSELSKTSILKKLSGGDLIGFEYKNKTPFEEKNYGKIIISTNNLPATTDKTIGFYRRWMIIDFPNTFTEKKDILLEIPDVEYENLALKSISILNELLNKREFHKEGTIEERMQRYENKSNFLEKFMKEFTQDKYDGYITKADFYKKFTAWCKDNRHREMSETMVGLSLKKLGIAENRKHFDWLFDGNGGYARIWEGIVWK